MDEAAYNAQLAALMTKITQNPETRADALNLIKKVEPTRSIPELDAKRFRRTEGGVTLITQPMIDKLAT